MIWHWFLHFTGSDNVSGPWYGFWSGFGSDISELALVGVLYRRFNCHAKGCWRLALHHVEGTAFVTCRKHHPGLNQRAHRAEAIAATYWRKHS